MGFDTGELHPTTDPGQKPAAQDRQYTWQDGDRTMTVLLQPDVTSAQESEIDAQDSTVVKGSLNDAAVKTAKSNASDNAGSTGMPVFRSQSGALMTLPGGVLLALDKAWGEAETDAFFERNGIEAARVSELAYIANGFFVETEPGFPSLDLANALATLDGVRASIPNWRQDLVAQ